MRLIAFPIAISLVGSAASADEAAAPLWRDLVVGDTREVVATKLGSVPGIKRVRISGDGDVRISYDRDAGVDIFGLAFAIVPEFEANGLSKVSLVRHLACVEDLEERYNDIAGVLREKYPDSPFPDYELTGTAFRTAIADAAAEHPSTLGIARYNAGAAVVLTYRFTRIDEPPTGYASTRSMRAAQELLWYEYQRKLDECPHFGRYRVDYLLTYMPRAAFDSLSQQIVDDAAAVSAESRNKL